MWIARNKDGTLILFKGKPVRGSLSEEWIPFGDTWQSFEIDKSLFSDIKWDNEPIEVILVIKPI